MTPASTASDLAPASEDRPVRGEDNQLLECSLVVPCYNEEAALTSCLDALVDAPLPPGAVWREWIVANDASTDRTAEVALAWMATHPGVPARVRENPHRTGKALLLEETRSRLESEPGDLVLVVCDADGEVVNEALRLLLGAFVEDRQLAVAWGWNTPAGPRRGRLASRFQVVVTEELARAAGPAAAPAFGRLFALRPKQLKGFIWRAGLISDDTILAEYVRRAGSPRRLIPGATISILPARGYRDFYLQTHRFFASREAIREEGLEGPRNKDDRGLSSARRTVAAVLRAARREPLGLPAYVIARGVVAVLNQTTPAAFQDRWETSTSTKDSFRRGEQAGVPGRHAVEPSESRRAMDAVGRTQSAADSLRLAWAKSAAALRLARRCEHGLRTAAIIALGYLPGTARLLPSDLVVTAQSGPTLRAARVSASYSPVIEVLVDNAYRLERLPWEESRSATLRVVDIGAHVGSFAVTLASRYPRATVTCFEPAPETVAYLERNIRTNGLEDRVIFHQAAVGAAAGTARLLRTAAGSCEATLEPALAPEGTKGIDVPVVDVETAFSLGGPPDLVKLDCEGGEYEIVLESDAALWESVRCILLEYHPVPGHSWSQLRAHLARLGFRVGWHDPGRIPGLGMAQLLR